MIMLFVLFDIILVLFDIIHCMNGGKSSLTYSSKQKKVYVSMNGTVRSTIVLRYENDFTTL